MIIAPDISSFQVALDKTFNRRVGIFRIEFGAHYLDPHFLANAAVANEMYRDGAIDGLIGYQVYLDSVSVAEQYAAVWKAIGPKIPDWLLGVMTDAELWRGERYAMRGNHSAQVNKLMGMHAHRFGSWNAAPWYGNEGDLAELIPQRDPRLWGILAAYTGDLHYKRIKGARGQQYTDGQPKYGSPRVLGRLLPTSTKPFGACDHNYLDFKDGKALRAFMRPATVAKPPVKPKPVPPPVKPKPAPFYDTSKRPAGVLGYSPDGNLEAILGNSGNVEIRKHGAHHYYLGKAPK